MESRMVDRFHNKLDRIHANILNSPKNYTWLFNDTLLHIFIYNEFIWNFSVYHHNLQYLNNTKTKTRVRIYNRLTRVLTHSYKINSEKW